MNFKTTFILFVLVVAGVFLWMYSGEKPETSDENAGAAKTAAKTEAVFPPELKIQDLVSLELQRPGDSTLNFARETNPDNPAQFRPWRMTAPTESDAEESLIDSLTRLLDGLQYKRSFKSGQGEVTLAEAGLDPPLATIKAVDRYGKEYVLAIGKPLALSNDTYIRASGKDEILVTSRNFAYDLERKPQDYRSKSILPFASADAQRIEIEYEGQRYDLARGIGNEWVINEPVKTYGRADAVKKWLDAAGRLRVSEFAEDHPAALESYGLAQPSLTVKITTEHTEEIKSQEVGPESQPSEPTFKTVVEVYTLLAGNFADLKSTARFVKLADKPWVAIVPRGPIEQLAPKLAELRDPKITRLKADAISAIEITADGATVNLSKQSGQWQGDGDLADLDADAIQALLRAIEDATAIDFIDKPEAPTAYGLDAPRSILKITAAGQVQPMILKIGQTTSSGQNAFVQVEGQDSVLVMAAPRAAELAVRPISLRSRTITQMAPDSVRRILLTHAEKRYLLQRKAESDGWEMLEPPDAPPDVNAIRTLATDLARLRAKQVTAKNADAEYGLDQPEITVEFEALRETEGPPAADSQPAHQAVETVQHTLRISDRDGRYFAKLDDIPYVFELDQTVHDVLVAEYIQPALFEIKSEAVANVSIESPNGLLQFARGEKDWTYPPDPYVKLSQQNVNELVKGLAELRVSGYIAYRDATPGEYGLDNAPLTVTLQLKDGTAITLKIDQARTDAKSCKAAWLERQRIFMLPYVEVEKLLRGLDAYLQSDKPEKAEEKPPARPARQRPPIDPGQRRDRWMFPRV